MPRNPLRSLPPPPVTASAMLIPTVSTIPGVKPQPWQKRAWAHYDSVGEVWLAMNFVANVLSRVRLFAAEQPDPMQPPEPSSNARANLELDRLRGDDGSFGQIIHDAALQLSVPGEGYLAGYATPENPDTWSVFSTEELEKKGSEWVRKLGSGGGQGQPLKGTGEDGVVVHRFWLPHPRFSMKADSPMRSIADPLDEILLLDRLYRSNARSRISAGVLLLPQEMSLPTRTIGGMETGQGQGMVQDPIVNAIIDALVTPVGDEESTANVAPAVIKLKGDQIEKIRHMVFARDFDEATAARYEKILERAITGLPIPNEIVTGMGEVNHWGAAQISASAFEQYLAPKIQLVCSAFTKAFFKPAMGSDGTTTFIWYDASGLMTKPSPDVVLQASEQKLISDESARKHIGFGEDDAPTPEELARSESAPAFQPAVGEVPIDSEAPA